MLACICFSLCTFPCILSMHQTQIHITTFSRTESQQSAPSHPHVISNEYIFSLSLSLPVLGHNHLSFQEPFSYICCRETLHYPSWLSFFPVWSVCMKQSSRGVTHTKTHYSQPTHTYLQLKARATDLRLAALKPNWQKRFSTSAK